MIYRILADDKTSGKIFANGNFFYGGALGRLKEVNIGSGQKTARATISIRPDLEEDELVISEDVLKELYLPDNVDYQVKLNGENIKIGPIIGLLMFTNKNTLTKGRLRKVLNYTTVYDHIGGLLVVFSQDSIDFENSTVEGYYYNDNAARHNNSWVKGVFPLPDSVFQRTNLSEDIRLKLIEKTNNRLFNSNYFNKWEFWKIVSKMKSENNNLPYTRLYKSINDIDNVVAKYGAAYLKPLYGTLSRGLYKVTATKTSYSFQGKQGGDVMSFYSSEEAENYSRKIMKGHKYLVQQAITPLKVKGRHLDFRVIMQKDHTLKWNCTGIVALIGASGDICTNWGTTATFEDITYEVFGYSQKEIFKKKSEVIAACKDICEILEVHGDNYADLGFDVIIDEDHKVWVLEANKRHYHSVPLWIDDFQTFYNTKANPIKYATAIAGFDVY